MSKYQFDATGRSVYRRLLGYARPHWQMFMLALIGMALAAATQPAFAALMKPLLDETFVQKTPTAVWQMPLAVIGIFVVRGIAEFLSVYQMSWVGRQVIKELRREVFNHFLYLPTRYYDYQSQGTLVSKLTYNIEQVAEATTNVLTTLVKDGLTVIGLLLWMFWLTPMLSLFIVVTVPVLVLLVRFVSRRFRRYSARIQNSMGDVTKVAEEAVHGQRVIKIFGGEPYESAHFETVNERNQRLNMKLVMTRAASVPLIQTIAALGISAVIYVARQPEVLHEVTPGTFVSFLSAMLLMTAPLKHLTNINAPLMKGIAAGQSIFELLDEPLEDAGGDYTVERAHGEIDYRDVRFAYNEEKGDVLHGLSLHIKPGERIAIVGRSGSGKSTLVGLLPRFYDVTAGQVTLDGCDIRDYRLDNLRDQLALVSQDVVLFNDSVARNIAYGVRSEASDEDIRKAADAAYALDFIEALPQGFETNVGDRGMLLSGGQRQRVAIARAILKDAPVLILDEATSALDTESESFIQRALEHLMEGRTTLIIAHRLSTIENADRIVVMDQGQIAEIGTHSELIAKDGIYANLHRLQFREQPAAPAVPDPA